MKKNRFFRNVSLIIIIVGVLGSAAIGLVSLRQNNLKMRELRDQVIMADEKYDGSKESRDEIDKALINLRNHVLRHMNTNLSSQETAKAIKPIQLVHKYYLDFKNAWYQEFRTSGAEVSILNQAAQICETNDYDIYQRSKCLNEKVEEVKQKELKKAFSIIDAKTDLSADQKDLEKDLKAEEYILPKPIIIPTDYYTYNFTSPSWSPDLAGLSFIFFAIFLLALIIRLAF